MQSSSKPPRAAEPDTKRLRAVNLGLTWPRAAFDNTYLLNVLKEKLGDKAVYILVCQESHEEGGLHNHTCEKVRSPFNTFDARMFDFKGRHTHVEPVKNLSWWFAFCKKTSNWIEVGDCPVKESRLSKKEKKNDFIREKAVLYGCITNPPTQIPVV